MARYRLSQIVILCLLASIASAQQPTFRVGATFVRVDAFVTKDGKPVLDLTPDDFELYEDGVRQTIRTFEHVHIPLQQTGPRRDPQSVSEGLQRAADPRHRVFVLFLDNYHADQAPSMASRKAFLRFLERLVGPDDLIAGMTPDMSPESISFGARTESLESFLNSLWGRRDSIMETEDEQFMHDCFSGPNSERQWRQVKERRRTKLTLDALEGLVRYLATVRDERKAVIAVTEGWDLYRENTQLMNDPDHPGRIHTGPTGPGTIMTPPVGGRGRPDSMGNGGTATTGDCDKLRMELSGMETVEQFRHLPDEANRANASFYVIDPRGLAASNDLMNASSVQADQAALRNKLELMRELADRTDGLALMNSNNLDAELTRIAQDLSSYYLFGYDSTNTKLDGSYRAITVKVKRPGVLVRARKGYRAMTLPAANESNSHGSGITKPSADNEITPAIASVMSTRNDLPVHLRATAVRLTGSRSELRVIAELDPKVAASDAWRQGGIAQLLVRGNGNSTDPSLSATATLAPGARILNTTIPLKPDMPAGDYHVAMRLNAQSHTDAVSDSTTVRIGQPGMLGEPLVLRRGLSTGTAYQPTGDLRFRRSDRIKLQTPSRLTAADVKVATVDLQGKPITLPVQVSDGGDGDAREIVVDVTLAPLAPGGYAIVVTTNPTASAGATERVIVPFSVIP